MSRITLGLLAIALSLAGVTASHAGPWSNPNQAVEHGLTTQNNGGGF